ncbi:MAG: hypothetical protein JWL67_698 [Solirubrobacterales bacterium]|nr:hypothetical protein [Solirubrobacterales bacterium]
MICLIVIASFVVFAVDQTKSASGRQQVQIESGAPAGAGSGTASSHESGVHKTIDEASSQLTSPFSGIASASSSEWAERGTRLLLALLVYGFGLGFLARTLRVRV